MDSIDKIREAFILSLTNKDYCVALEKIVIQGACTLDEAIELLTESKDVLRDADIIWELSCYGYSTEYIAGYLSCTRIQEGRLEYKDLLKYKYDASKNGE